MKNKNKSPPQSQNVEDLIEVIEEVFGIYLFHLSGLYDCGLV